MKNDENENEHENEHENKTQKSIDQLTMELLLNKTQYHKYLAKTDAQKHAEYCEFLEGCSQYRKEIIDITVDLLDENKNKNKNKESNKYSQEVQQAFDEYAKTVIRYLEIQESVNSQYKEDDDEDMMFPPSMNR